MKRVVRKYVLICEMQMQERERRGKRGWGRRKSGRRKTEEEQEKEEEGREEQIQGESRGRREKISAPAIGGFNPACFDAHS